MEVIRPGFEYRLVNFSDKEKSQTIRFISKTAGVVDDGTTNEEIFAAMQHRFYHLQKISYSKENSVIIALLDEIRELLKRRLDRKIELVKSRKEDEKIKDKP